MTKSVGVSLTGIGLAILLLIAISQLPLGSERHEVPPRHDAAAELQQAFEDRRDGFWVEAVGQVIQILPDDRQGSRHQRLILRLENGQTLLIAHNIDLAPRLAGIEVGDRLRFRGEYAWNPQGGVIHWTHHDPDGSHTGGWLEWNGRRFR